METEYLFSRKFNGNEYKFYHKSMDTKWGLYSYFEIDTQLIASAIRIIFFLAMAILIHFIDIVRSGF